MDEHRITDPTNIETFLFGGNATFTLVSSKTGARFTFHVRRGEERDGRPAPWFVRLMTGPNNRTDFVYIGAIFPDAQDKLVLTRWSYYGDSAPNVKAFRWLLSCLNARRCDSIEFWHEGKCGRCGRRLTVPTSIETGIGPVCATLMAA